MKLILREYLASLREREELDAILPDLISELGFTVFSRPQRGTTQYGVDVGAVSRESEQKRRKVYLFSIKKGDLTRAEWHAVPQGMRSSLTEILDVYIPTRLPSEYAEQEIVICLCVGGEIQEQVRDHVAGFTKAHTTDRITFEEWTGDRLANLLLEGVLGEEVLPREFRSHFQKAVALLDEPDVAYRHFSQLLRQLHTSAADDRARVRVARQIYICVWVLFVWGRDIGNFEGPYLASELAILTTWELLKPLIGVENQHHRALVRVLDQIIKVHLRIADEYISKRIASAAKLRDALGMAVGSRTAVDVNLKLFDLVGRVAMTGMWVQWFVGEQPETDEEVLRGASRPIYEIGMAAIENNSGLHLPINDEQTTNIALFALFCLRGAPDGMRLMSWLESLVERFDLTVRVRGKYPVAYAEYSDLVAHPRDDSDEYFKEATAGSTLAPFLASWARGLGRPDLATRLAKLASEKLQHCTMQLWTPGEDSEKHLYVNSSMHGRAICDLPMANGGADLLETISAACKSDLGCQSLSAVQTGFWPIILLACRHWRLPVPPDFYIDSLLAFIAETYAQSQSAQPTDGSSPDGGHG